MGRRPASGRGHRPGEFRGGELDLIIETSWKDGEGKKYHDGDCPHITISAYIDRDRKTECTLAFEMSKMPKTTDSNKVLIDNLVEIDSYSLDGAGYSIHPKQILTVALLERLLENELLHKQEVSITYLGTDTGENLYSVIRSLRASGLWSRISGSTYSISVNGTRNTSTRRN